MNITSLSSKKVFVSAVIAMLAEAPLHADIVQADDVIIQGSACVGFDCVNNEVFGVDQLHLKENNTRILFNDTSTATFPANDWRLEANDSAAGGQDRFSIVDVTGATTPFTVLGAAPTHALYVNSLGNVGLSTSSPLLELHILDSDTPGIRLEQDGSGGFQAQTWDVAGNEANFFIRDLTSGSRLPFRIRPGAPTSSLDIAASGNVGVGVAAPQTPLHIQRITNPKLFVESTGVSTTELAELSNRGNSLMHFTNTALSNCQTWEVGHYTENPTNVNPDVFFLIDDPTTPFQEFKIKSGGQVIVAGVTVHPDYVFEPNYSLMPLAEVEAYVKRNKHLPEVPSAADVAKDGVNLTAMSSTLLKKVEELTLYVIEQDKQLKKQRQEIDALKKIIKK